LVFWTGEQILDWYQKEKGSNRGKPAQPQRRR